ncbi:MAG: AAA family ATPase, partial [Acidobacteriota bacterium]
MIERIIIENFKSIRKLDLELKPINILIGANGAGKSNFISFFKLLKSLYVGNLNFLIGHNISSFLHFGRKRSKYFYGLIDIENTTATHFRISPEFNSNAAYIEKLGVLLNTQNISKNYEEWKEVFNETTKTESDLYQIDEPYAGNIQDYFDNSRVYHFQDVSEEARIKLPNKINDNKYLRENGENLASYLYYLQEKHSRNFRIIEAQIRSVASFFNRFDLEPDRLRKNYVELRWFEKGSEDYFDAYDLSDG